MVLQELHYSNFHCSTKEPDTPRTEKADETPSSWACWLPAWARSYCSQSEGFQSSWKLNVTSSVSHVAACWHLHDENIFGKFRFCLMYKGSTVVGKIRITPQQNISVQCNTLMKFPSSSHGCSRGIVPVLTTFHSKPNTEVKKGKPHRC